MIPKPTAATSIADMYARERFLAAYVDEHPFSQCQNGVEIWNALHGRESFELGWFVREIDEDPPGTKRWQS